MDKQRLISHVAALVPDIPAHEIAAFALELVETLRNEGRQMVIPLSGAAGTAVAIPDEVISVIEVMRDGVTVPQTLTDIDYSAMNTESEDWGTDTYLADGDGAMLMENETYIIQ
jgi:hypothetical protein